MEPNALFDSSTPFENNKLQILENVIYTMYNTKNNQDRTIADNILKEFQTFNDAWLYVDFIINNANYLYTKIYAVSIIDHLIRTRWNILPADQKLGIRNFMVDYLIKLVTDDQLFESNQALINKINIVIVQIAKYEWTTTWTDFMSEICNSSKSNQNLCENNLKILQMLNEEINEFWKSSLTEAKAKELKQQMANEFSSVFDLCCFIFANTNNVRKSLSKAAIRVYADYIKWFPLDYVFKTDLINSLLDDLVSKPTLRLDLMKCFGEIFVLDINIMGEENYFQIKQMIMNIYKSYINQMISITHKTNFIVEYNKLDISKKGNFEEFSLQFVLSLINFFKNNFSFIENFDFEKGETNSNEFTLNYLNEISTGLSFISQIHQIDNDEIMKSTSDFWNWFTLKVLFVKEKDLDPENFMYHAVSFESIYNYIAFAVNRFYVSNVYLKVLEQVRITIITKMTKPTEVRFYVDENGELSMDQFTNTIYQAIHETNRDTLIYLTHLDPILTETILLEMLQSQTIEENWNPQLLNSICWSIGCIAGSMEENNEKRFIVMVIKHLLNLCEMKKGKVNKATVAGDIMYVVGQYPRFLNTHWKFLKTVIKKLFEFMHESFQGVQDFACETFLKISLKCGEQIAMKQKEDPEPYINVLVTTIADDTVDLQSHQKLMFYEAIGNIIYAEPNYEQKCRLVQQMMQFTYNDWATIFNAANNNTEVLLNQPTIKALDLIVKLNERAAYSVKTAYFAFGSYIYDNILSVYSFYCGLLNDFYNQANLSLASIAGLLKSIKKTILKFLTTLISSNESPEMVHNTILPPLSVLIDQYKSSHPDNRDPEVLNVFTAVLEKIKNFDYNYISSIWQYLCLFTLEMIKLDFQSYPEHRMNFFSLVKALITNAFDGNLNITLAIFKIGDSSFNKNVLNAIIWAAKHDQPQISEIGLETLLTLVGNINSIRISNGINIADSFYRDYFFEILNEIFYILTDSFHKSGFKFQVDILLQLIFVVETNIISPFLFDSNSSNKDVIFNYMVNLLTNAFTHMNKTQIETFCIALFNKVYNRHEFVSLIRDFLTTMKSFAEDNESLYQEEKNKQLDEAKRLEERKKMMIPGLAQQYDNVTQQKFSSVNYNNQANN